MTAPALDDLDRAILPLLAEGLSATEIGRRVYLSPAAAKRRAKAIRDAINTRDPGGNPARDRSIPRQPRADPAQVAALQPLVRQYAARHGDTPAVTAARRAALLADLDQHQTRRGDTSGRERAVIRHHARQHTSTETTAVTGTDTKDPR